MRPLQNIQINLTTQAKESTLLGLKNAFCDREDVTKMTMSLTKDHYEP